MGSQDKDLQDKDWQDKLILWGATGFGLGFIPVAPGTFGTLAALPLIWIMTWTMTAMGPGSTALFLAALILAAVWLADRAEAILGKKDPGSIVVDEMAGYCVTMTLVPVSWETLILGFAAFRCFDIFKSPPVRYFETRYSGGAGVVLDDIMAGVMAALSVKIIYLLGLF